VPSGNHRCLPERSGIDPLLPRWHALAEAIAACVRGDIADLKTELGLRRLRDHLAR